jgi:3-hydroxyisobutyrate dehydrogenase
MSARDVQGEGTRIGFVGLGNLGLPMAATACRAGFDVAGFDLRAEALAELDRVGGTPVDSIEALADRDVVALAVLDDAQVSEVVELLVEHLDHGSVVVVHSTVLPETVRSLARRTAAEGIHLLDVPVSGGDIAARKGTLTLMIGGSPDTVGTVRPYLEAVGENLCELGPLGAGAAGKLANQMMTFLNQLGAMEAMKLAAVYDVDEEQVMQLASTSTSDSWIIRNWGFFDRIHDEYERGGTPLKLRPWAKDLWDVMILARENELSLPLSALAAQLSLPMFAERSEGRN